MFGYSMVNVKRVYMNKEVGYINAARSISMLPNEND